MKDNKNNDIRKNNTADVQMSLLDDPFILCLLFKL